MHWLVHPTNPATQAITKEELWLLHKHRHITRPVSKRAYCKQSNPKCRISTQSKWMGWDVTHWAFNIILQVHITASEQSFSGSKHQEWSSDRGGASSQPGDLFRPEDLCQSFCFYLFLHDVFCLIYPSCATFSRLLTIVENTISCWTTMWCGRDMEKTFLTTSDPEPKSCAGTRPRCMTSLPSNASWV